MKRLIISLLLSTFTFGQLLFNQDSIAIGIEEPKSVYVIDIDNDSDADIICAIDADASILWYENDGSENFTEHVVTNNAVGAQGVFAVDLDQDGDIDILSASEGDDKIAWYENDGFDNLSFTEHVISTSEDYAYYVSATDLDQDGDIDVLSTSWMDDRVAWHENDGSENFTTHIITTAFTRPYSAFSIDLDQDGDIDVLSTASSSNVIAWHENDGSQNFTSHIITDSATWAHKVQAIDIDGDNDIDVVSANTADGIYWYENDGSENFTEHVIVSAFGLSFVYTIDINNDNEIDVIIPATDDYLYFGIIVAINQGNGFFALDTISSSPNEFIEYVFPYDLDGDLDIDIVASKSHQNDEIYWCENLYSKVLYVSTTGSDVTGDGSETNPFATIQTGIDSSSDGEIVLVAAGTYVENINIGDKRISVIGENRETTIIDGDSSGSVVTFEAEEGVNYSNDTTAVLSGFTITNGAGLDGGGIYCIRRSPSFSDLIITDNIANGNYPNDGNGGGIYINFSHLRITNVIINNNTANYNGGGIYFEDGELIMSDASIMYNSAFCIGTGEATAAVKTDNTQHTFTNSTINNNNSSGLWLDGGGNNLLSNLSITENTGTGIIGNGGTVLVTTISGNSDGGMDGGGHLYSCIVWNNSSYAINLGTNSIIVDYSDIEGGWIGPGTGNIDADPLFCNPDSGDYTLAENSPCIGTGYYWGYPEYSNMGAFGVGCGPYNFTPTEFSLTEPSNNSEIMIDASNVDNGSITFSWDESSDANNDLLMYLMSATSNEIGNHDVDTIATSFSVPYVDIIEDMTDNNVTIATIEWTVHVTDGIDTVEADNAPFTVAIDGGYAMNTFSEALIPEVFALHQNYPNPFNPITTLRYDLPENSYVNVTVYDMLGREVKTLVNSVQNVGFKSVLWNATNNQGNPVSAGVYLYQIQAGEFRQTKKMVLLK